MGLRYERWISRDMLRREPKTLFVFGDNFQARGLGGQAKEMRGEPSAIGIPTKREPSNRPEAFFTDDEPAGTHQRAVMALSKLVVHLELGGDVVWPADGIGTGLADLPRRAPRLWAYLEAKRRQLEQIPSRPVPLSLSEEGR